jgi:hypothetical protein
MEEYCTYYINNKAKKSPRAYTCNTWKFHNIEKETPLLTPQRDHTKVLGSNTGRCVGTSQTDYSLTSKVYLLKYQGPKMFHCRIQLLCSCCNPLVASLSSQLSSAATRNMCWSPETSQFKLDEKSGFSSRFQSSGFHRPGFNYH